MEGRGQGNAGFVLGELAVVLAIVACLAAVAAPSLLKFYRETALEYESECLLADLRRTQSLSRMVADKAWLYGQQEPMEQKASIRVEETYYVFRVKSHAGETARVHHYLPFVHVRRNDQPAGSGNRTISFLQNGGLDDIGRQMMTLVLYCEGWENEGRKIMISRAGRIRIKRMMR
ncbi:hypothetical protein FZ041_10885 [Selenomonas caprae]|uniref:Tfp pilus assembly protein FimT n=1 Tax=Selenomonas caprae TaxID=2606905 RepID=A0A5D6WHU4_9FIRM|nr:hypothetical protein [Selenomonas caprae]TYZ27626.1 hypothetical protein FZ041_10885 [Selenomonas caprae]